QVRAELLSRKGKPVIYKYLTRLAGCAAVGAAIGVGLMVLSLIWRVPAGYGLVIAGSMAGAWLSAASNRRDVTFVELPGYLGSRQEPWVRIAFVAVLAVVVALLLKNGVFTVMLG